MKYCSSLLATTLRKRLASNSSRLEASPSFPFAFSGCCGWRGAGVGCRCWVGWFGKTCDPTSSEPPCRSKRRPGSLPICSAFGKFGLQWRWQNPKAALWRFSLKLGLFFTWQSCWRKVGPKCANGQRTRRWHSEEPGTRCSSALSVHILEVVRPHQRGRKWHFGYLKNT